MNSGPDVALATLKSVLDTVRITASRIYKDDANGFERRSKLGSGH